MTQEEINRMILDKWDKEGLANGWVNEHIKNNELKQQVEYLQSKIDKAIEYVSNLSSKGRDCEIYYDIKKEILDILKEDE